MDRFWRLLNTLFAIVAIGLLVAAIFVFRSRWQATFFSPQTAAPAAQATPTPAAQSERSNLSPLPTPTNAQKPVWTAQDLRIVSDEPFVINAFALGDSDEIDDPKWSPDGASVIVKRTTGFEQINEKLLLPNQELWVLRLDGTGEFLGESTLAGEWSPNGQQIAYLQRQPTTAEYSLWTRDRQTGSNRQILNNSLQLKPLWLGNNSLLFPAEDGTVSATNTESLSRAPITPVRAFVHQFQSSSLSLSPDGFWLAIRSVDNPNKLTVVATQGQGRPWIIPEGEWATYSVIIGSIAWSPDSSKLAFTGYNREVGDTIYVVEPANQLRRHLNLQTHSDSSPGSSTPRSLSWSPDGNVLLFVARNESNRVANLYIVNADGSGLRNINQNINLSVRTPAWSPDGKHILYTTERDIDRNEQFRIMAVAPK